MNQLLATLETELSYRRINKILCPHNPNIDYDAVYNIVYRTYYDHHIDTPDIYALMQRLNDTVKVIGLEWMTNRGKFIKRLVKAMPELAPVSGILGDLIQRKAYQADDYNWYVSLTDKIFWDNGNFGNYSSCWWTMYPESRKIFIDNNGIALLFHNNPDDLFNGFGRCWILPINHYFGYKTGTIDGLVLFNQYGEHMVDDKTKNIRLDDTARYIKSIIPDTDATEIRLYNDDDDYNPYINDNSGILIKQIIHDVAHNHEIHLNMGGCGLISCYDCNEMHDADDMHEFRHRQYCDDCYSNNFDDCYECGETDYQSNMLYHDYANYCHDCFNKLFTECSECRDYYVNSEMTEYNFDQYCESCLNDNFTICESCGEFTPNDDITIIDNICYCENCIPEPEST